MKDVLKEMTNNFILLYESNDGFYKFALGETQPCEKDMLRLIAVANEIFVKAEREKIANEILNKIK